MLLGFCAYLVLCYVLFARPTIPYSCYSAICLMSPVLSQLDCNVKLYSYLLTYLVTRSRLGEAGWR